MSLARFLHRLGDHGVHQADDGRFAGHVAKLFEVLAACPGLLEAYGLLGWAASP
jgi:hypothetical protein